MFTMEFEYLEKVIIVEGKTDKEQIEDIIDDQVIILCTYGTFSIERFDELLEEYQLDDREVFILVDEDDAGVTLRKELARELPHAGHIYINGDYKEVATTPKDVLAPLLVAKYIHVRPHFLR